MSEKRDDILPPEEAPDASSKLFREYAAEFVELARNATSADQRFLYLKMANIWRECEGAIYRDFTSFAVRGASSEGEAASDTSLLV